MRCSRCGKQVPFFGVDCTHCGADKSQAQAMHALGIVCAGAGLGIGLALGGIVGLLVGGLMGATVFIVTQIFINSEAEQQRFPSSRHGGRRIMRP